MQKKLDQLFPLRRIRNVSMFYVLSSVYNMWFVGGIWIFIWGRFMTKTEIGISDLITFTVGFLVELPSGVFADTIGRKKAILLGNIMLTIGNFGVAFGSSFASITTWYLIWTMGYAFQSGATEALAYDSVKKANKEKEWSKVIGTSVVIARTTALIAYPIGGLLFAVWFRLPYIAFAVSGIIGVLAALRLNEIHIKSKISMWSVKNYTQQIKDGLSVLTKTDVFPIGLVSLFTAGLAYLYNWGLLRPLTGERFGYTPVTLPFLLIAVSFAVILATGLFIRVKKRFKTSVWIYGISLIYFTLFFMMGYNFGLLVGGSIMILLTVCSVLTDQLFSEFINKHTESKHRATTLSATALLIKLPYVLLAIPMGFLAENNKLAEFCLIAGATAMFIWLISRFKYSKIKISK